MNANVFHSRKFALIRGSKMFAEKSQISF